MVNTPAVYPTSVTTFTVKQNKIDVYNDDHINKLQNEVVALQTYIGTNPHGDQSTLSLRLRQALSGSGGFVLTTGVPTTTYPGLFYYRTDSETLFNIRSDNVPQAVGGSLTNVVFSFSGSSASSNSLNAGMYVGTSLIPGPGDANLDRYVCWANDSTSYGTAITSKVKKIQGMSTLTVWSFMKSHTDESPTLRITIGSVIGSIVGALSSSYVWGSIAMDLTGLNNGTTYDAIFDLKTASGSRVAMVSSIIGIVS